MLSFSGKIIIMNWYSAENLETFFHRAVKVMLIGYEARDRWYHELHGRKCRALDGIVDAESESKHILYKECVIIEFHRMMNMNVFYERCTQHLLLLCIHLISMVYRPQQFLFQFNSTLVHFPNSFDQIWAIPIRVMRGWRLECINGKRRQTLKGPMKCKCTLTCVDL